MPAGDDLRGSLVVPVPVSLLSTQATSRQERDIALREELRPDTPRVHKSASKTHHKSAVHPANNKAEVTMELDYPTTLPSAHVDTPITAPIEGVYSIDDYLATHSADHDATASSRDAPPPKKAKASTSTLPQPVAVGARSSKYTILLHEKYQALAIPQPLFSYHGSSDTRWAVEVSFPGLAGAEELQGLQEEGRFNSKQEAKEAMSKTALEKLEQLVLAGRVVKAGKTKKKGEPAYHAPQEREEPGENYVGQLLEFQRATSAPQPTYTDYQVGTRWACLLEIDGHPTPFSTLDALFGSKKLARQHAAGCAVSHFKSQNQWPENFTDVGGIKKKKTQQNPSPTATPANPTLTSSSPSSSPSNSPSLPQQVAALAQQLSLPTPEWRFAPSSPGTADFHTVSCYFKNGGALEGPLGSVRNVFGRKKAKEECARLTLSALLEVKRAREEWGRKLMEDLEGGGVGVGGGGLDGAVDGKGGMSGEVGGEVKSVTAKDDDDDLDIYEDAMES